MCYKSSQIDNIFRGSANTLYVASYKSKILLKICNKTFECTYNFHDNCSVNKFVKTKYNAVDYTIIARNFE